MHAYCKTCEHCFRYKMYNVDGTSGYMNLCKNSKGNEYGVCHAYSKGSSCVIDVRSKRNKK